jgi:sirohydrochlorin cobaltochelatase
VNVPVVLTAFGSTAAARKAYAAVGERVKKALPDHDVRWAYTSRMVRQRCRREKGLELESPRRVLQALGEQGHRWAVVQSLHLLCGYEFQRLVEEVQCPPCRVSMGLPLLWTCEDYRQFLEALSRSLPPPRAGEAVILVGHGTDHPSWVSYVALQRMLEKQLGPRWHLGVVEGCPTREETLEEILRAGFRRVRLVPLMMVAGIHVREDLMGADDSWKTAFEQKGVEVDVEAEGLLSRPEITAIFIRHIQEALQVIPETAC